MNKEDTQDIINALERLEAIFIEQGSAIIEEIRALKIAPATEEKGALPALVAHKRGLRALEQVINATIFVGDSALSVFDLVELSLGVEVPDAQLTPSNAHYALQRHGMKLRDDRLLFANQSENLKLLVRGTEWEGCLRKALLGIHGADRFSNRSQKFNGADSKCISIPAKLLPLLFEEVEAE